MVTISRKACALLTDMQDCNRTVELLQEKDTSLCLQGCYDYRLVSTDIMYSMSTEITCREEASIL